MKYKLITVVLLNALFLSSIALGQVDTITLLHINDTHSCLAPIGPRDASLQGSLGGIARVASLVGQLRASNPNILFLHSGDAFVGDLFFNTYFGVPEFQLLQAIGLDAMTVGNHEFDLTPAALLTALDSSFTGGGFPLLSANLILEDPTVKQLRNYIHPYTIKQAGSVKVGIFGLTTPATNTLSQPQPAVVDSGFIQTGAMIVDSLKAKGCQLIICLSHLGLTFDELLAQSVPGIHVIVGGHDHYTLRHPVQIQDPAGETTLIVQANAFYLHLGKLTLLVSGNKVRMLSYQMYEINNSIPQEPSIKNIVDNLKMGIEQTYPGVFTHRIGYATNDFEEVADSLTTDGYKDTPIGNLVTTAFRAALGTEIAIEPGGSTAQKLYKGPLVADDLFRVVGYGFNQQNGLGYFLATFKMSGEALLSGLEFGLSTIEENDEYLLQTSGLVYTYNAHRPAGKRVTRATVHGQPLDPYRLYTVTANQFIPLFLDYLQIPYSDLHICSGDTTEFQVLTKYVEALDTIKPERRGSMTSPVKDGVSTIPSKCRLDQNFPNPFNPSTKIEYQLSSDCHVTLNIYDMLGRLIAVLVDARKQTGTYSITWNASHVSSGVYFYRLEATGKDNTHFVNTKKLFLIK
jgi:5'-nucleotidase